MIFYNELMNIPVSIKMTGIIIMMLTHSCSVDDKIEIAGVRTSFPGSNVSNAQVDVHTTDLKNISIRYGIAGQDGTPHHSKISAQKRDHQFLITDLKPGQQYVFNIVTSIGKLTKVSRDYFFRTIFYTSGVQDTFQVVCADTSAVPEAFRQGYVMVHRREVPGIIALLNARGDVVWHQQSKDAGFKVVQFTKDQTLLCILGTKEYETSYGAAIIELSLKGDTLLYLQKGQNDFQQTIHHEIISNSKNEIVTLCVEDRIMDLRSIGGLVRDTVRGDGILVLDRHGNKKWKWTVFDELDPLKDEKILQTKKDWMHANSVSFDKDGHYLISFYNNGQIWKVDAITGKVIWKLGKGGDFKMPTRAHFDQAHAVHINNQGWIHFFDNGTSKKLSRSMAFVLDEKAKKAELVIDTWLPPQLFSDRMGSSYLVGNEALLQCASKHKRVVLTTLGGALLWELQSSRIMSYRAVFVPGEKLTQYLAN